MRRVLTAVKERADVLNAAVLLCWQLSVSRRRRDSIAVLHFTHVASHSTLS